MYTPGEMGPRVFLSWVYLLVTDSGHVDPSLGFGVPGCEIPDHHSSGMRNMEKFTEP